MSQVPMIAPIDVLQWKYNRYEGREFLKGNENVFMVSKVKNLLDCSLRVWRTMIQRNRQSGNSIHTDLFRMNKLNEFKHNIIEKYLYSRTKYYNITKITILQNYNLLAQEIVLLFTNEYSTNIFFHIFHSVAVVGLKCLQGLHFCQLSGTHWTTSPSIALESVPMEALLLPTFFALFLWTVLL